ncbi:NADP-dependent oxidoreductase [Amycolatopsis jejuensis]|uniref:NADP-dependent oxidoreductase n=1 Tax=Amycolatopsis jejuensis TaxID=330084 RepID=UPI000523F75E|nr:NADP-dependent oxidoreductase [Amycolatopsis jejuensis]
MKALAFDRYGDPNVLAITDVPEPHPGPRKIRIAVRAAGASPADAALRSGAWRDRIPLTLPHVVGLDAAGIVDEIGHDVTGVQPGDEVFGCALGGGTTAAYAVLDAWAPKPAALPWPAAGAAATSIETSLRALDHLKVDRGTTVLLDGASGGVGAIAVQIAVARGARVIGTASADNHEFLRTLGATPVHHGPDLAARTGPVDAAIDVSGKGSLAELVAATGSPDRVVTLINPAAEAEGIELLRYDPAADHSAALRRGAQLIADGKLTVPILRTYPLSAGSEAHAQLETGHTQGKIAFAR